MVNLRGTIIPIVDMRLRFNCSEVEYNAFTVVIILNLRNRVVGIVVDSVSDVLELSAAFQALAHETADHKEAVDAFTEKRAPKFTGA